jgi:hypothetical protein
MADQRNITVASIFIQVYLPSQIRLTVKPKASFAKQKPPFICQQGNCGASTLPTLLERVWVLLFSVA